MLNDSMHAVRNTLTHAFSVPIGWVCNEITDQNGYPIDIDQRTKRYPEFFSFVRIYGHILKYGAIKPRKLKAVPINC